MNVRLNRQRYFITNQLLVQPAAHSTRQVASPTRSSLSTDTGTLVWKFTPDDRNNRWRYLLRCDGKRAEIHWMTRLTPLRQTESSTNRNRWLRSVILMLSCRHMIIACVKQDLIEVLNLLRRFPAFARYGDLYRG